MPIVPGTPYLLFQVGLLVGDDGSNVLVASDSLKSFRQDWWLTYVTSRRYRLGPRSDLAQMWEPFCRVAAVSLPIPP